MKLSIAISIIVMIFGLIVALWWRQPYGFVLTAVGAVMLIYFFLSSDGKKKK